MFLFEKAQTNKAERYRVVGRPSAMRKGYYFFMNPPELRSLPIQATIDKFDLVMGDRVVPFTRDMDYEIEGNFLFVPMGAHPRNKACAVVDVDPQQFRPEELTPPFPVVLRWKTADCVRYGVFPCDFEDDQSTMHLQRLEHPGYTCMPSNGDVRKSALYSFLWTGPAVLMGRKISDMEYSSGTETFDAQYFDIVLERPMRLLCGSFRNVFYTLCIMVFYAYAARSKQGWRKDMSVSEARIFMCGGVRPFMTYVCEWLVDGMIDAVSTGDLPLCDFARMMCGPFTKTYSLEERRNPTTEFGKRVLQSALPNDTLCVMDISNAWHAALLRHLQLFYKALGKGDPYFLRNGNIYVWCSVFAPLVTNGYSALASVLVDSITNLFCIPLYPYVSSVSKSHSMLRDTNDFLFWSWVRSIAVSRMADIERLVMRQHARLGSVMGDTFWLAQIERAVRYLHTAHSIDITDWHKRWVASASDGGVYYINLPKNKQCIMPKCVHQDAGDLYLRCLQPTKNRDTVLYVCTHAHTRHKQNTRLGILYVPIASTAVVRCVYHHY